MRPGGVRVLGQSAGVDVRWKARYIYLRDDRGKRRIVRDSSLEDSLIVCIGMPNAAQSP